MDETNAKMLTNEKNITVKKAAPDIFAQNVV